MGVNVDKDSFKADNVGKTLPTTDINELATKTSGESGEYEHRATTPAQWICNCLCFKHSCPEATAWAMDAAARGPLIMANVFIGKTLLGLAHVAAGCDPLQTDVICHTKIYGFLPSSLLTNMVTMCGIINACLMPVIGAIVDHTTHRHLVGTSSTILLLLLHGSMIGISQETWFAMVIIQIIGSFAYLSHVVVAFAYFSELSSDRRRIARLSASYNIKQYVSSLFFLVAVTGLGVIFEANDVNTTRISQCIVVVTVICLMGPAWLLLFKTRPALSVKPEGHTLLYAGFAKLGRTFREIATKYKALRWMVLSLLFSEAAGNSFPQVAITFTDGLLKMNVTETGLLMLILLISSVPGSKLSTFVTNTYNPKVSYMCALLFFGLTTITASLVLTNVERKNYAYFFAFCWGVGFGWSFPAQRTLWVMIIPKNQETEMMGIYIFCGQILLWLPPLIFTIMNESGVRMNYGFMTQSMFYFISALALVCVGDFEKAVIDVRPVGGSVAQLDVGPAVVDMGGIPCGAEMEKSVDCDDGDGKDHASDDEGVEISLNC